MTGVETVTIDRRYRGPLQSANGGYACGLLGSRVGPAAEVTLRLPPPLERPLTIRRDGERLVLEDGDLLVAEAIAGDPGLEPPAPPDPVSAAAAAEGVGAFGPPEFAECFVCGARGTGAGSRSIPVPCPAARGSSRRPGRHTTSPRR